MPKEQPLELKLFLHEPGTTPDVLKLELSHEAIHENPWTKIGVSITSHEATDNFLAMGKKKRGCAKNIGEVIDRTKCLTNLVQEYAIGQCNCIPRNFENQGFLKCNMSGMYCFRNATTHASNNKDFSDLCDKPCEYKEYHTTRSIDIGMNPFDMGEEAVRFLASNPTNIILKNLTKSEYGYDSYIWKIWESYSFLQIYFDNPQMTVITKDAKVTLPDMVSSIGGTIGIFLGLSTLSMLDVLIHWFNIVQKRVKKY